MDHAYHTRELASAYETQGYYKEALEIYTRLDETFQGTDTDVQASCRRVETLLAREEPGNRETRLTALLENWLTLWRMSHHLTTMTHLIAQVRSRK
jgi:hypothetical protein